MDETAAALLDKAEQLVQALLRLPNYKSQNPIGEIAAIQAKIMVCRADLNAKEAADAVEETERNEREDLRQPFLKLFSDLNIYAKASGLDENDLDTLGSFNREMRGRRAAPVKADNPDTPENEAEAHISPAQTTYISLVEHARNSVQFLTAQNWKSIEPRFTIENLTAEIDKFEARNIAIAAKDAASDATRRTFYNSFYLDPDNLVDSCSVAKLNVKATEGSDSIVWEQIAGLKFRKPPKFR